MKDIPSKERQALALLSGGVCAFPRCDHQLISPDSPRGAPVIVGEIAHVVARQRQGPRGNVEMSDDDRNRSSNLLYLCGEHHKVVDDHPRVYSVPVLRQMKADHEARMMPKGGFSSPPTPAMVDEQVHSTLLPFTHLPATVFSARCTVRSSDPAKIAPLLDYAAIDREELAAFTVRDGRLYAFQDLTRGPGPYDPVVGENTAAGVSLASLAADPEGRRIVVALLNAAVRKLLQPRRVRFDKVHARFWFACIEEGTPRSESYRTFTGRNSSIQVAWPPVRRSTGERRDFWWHRAARISVHATGDGQWALSIRPERHLTIDGVAPLSAIRVGRRVTSLKARMYNDKYLDEVWLWKAFLAGGGTDIILPFGGQNAIIAPHFLRFDLSWPGVVGDRQREMHERSNRDLFEWARYRSAVEDDEDDLPDE